MSEGLRCPRCGRTEIRRSYRRTLLSLLSAFLFLIPCRCRMCRIRFYQFAFRVPPHLARQART